MTVGIDFVGRLVLRPGQPDAVRCERPAVGADLLDRLARGRRALLLPDILGAVFTLCAQAQRATSRRAIRAALAPAPLADDSRSDDGRSDDSQSDGPRADQARSLSLHAAREHLLRFGLDMTAFTPPAGPAGDLDWVRGMPPDTHLAGWLRDRLFGLDCAAWCDRWERDGSVWLTRWSRDADHPLARWLAAVREEAVAIDWPCRPLEVTRDPGRDMRELARALVDDPDMSHHPRWHGSPAETGPWTRRTRPWAVHTAWDRFGARLADVARIGAGESLDAGALTVDDGEGIAWTETSRGLLVHWVRLHRGDPPTAGDAAEDARVAAYRVLAPTEWNFHPEGAFAGRLREPGLPRARVALAARSLDPCIEFTIEEASPHA